MQQKSLIEAYEQIFLKDVFYFSFDINNTDTNLVFLPQTYRQIEKQPSHPVSIATSDSLLDAAIFERMQMANTNPLIFLNESRARLEEARDKPWNQLPNIQQLAKAASELIQNYSRFALISPDELFPNRVGSVGEQQESSNHGKIAMRLLDIFEKVEFGQDFFVQMQPIIEEECNNDVYYHLLRIIYQELRKHNIFSTKVFMYINLIKIFLSNERLKEVFFTQTQFPWIPGPQGIALSSGVGAARGDQIEVQSAFGQLLRPSLLPPLIQSQKDRELVDQVGNRTTELSHKQTKSSYNQRMRQFHITQRRYQGELTELFKLLLKKGTKIDYFAETFRWLTACLVGNVNRIKEGVHMNRSLQNYSSDAFMLNLYDIMLDMSRKIFDRQDQQTYLKIDPIFWLSGKLETLHDQPLLTQQVAKAPNKQEAGNVSNLYFYTLKFVHFGYLTTLKNYKNILNQIDELKKGIEMLKESPMHLAKLTDMKKNLEELDRRANQYEAAIFDEQRIKDTQEIFQTFIMLFLQWIQVDVTKVKNGQWAQYQPSWVLQCLPEHIIDDIFEFHLFYAYHKDDYLEATMNAQKMDSLLTMTTLLGTHLQLANNRYLEAKFIELIFLLLKIDRKNAIVKNVLRNSPFALNNFIHGLIKFYVEIEQTGANHQFYSKFSYRLYTNELLIDLLQLEPYKQEMIAQQGDPMFERMKKMIMNDINYSIDEAWTKLDKVNHTDKDEQTMNPNDRMQSQHQRRFMIQQIKSNLQHAMSTVKLLVELSRVFPNAFLNDVHRDPLATMLNHFLELLLDRKHSPIIKLIKLENLEKQDFKLDHFLLQLGHLYTNFMESQEFLKSVVKDQRSFKLDYFTSMTYALNKYPKAPHEKLILLTQKLQEASEEDFDIENLIEIPERYQDPLMGSLMKDPVKLPSSDLVVDRSSIKMVLLDKEEDPWTRKPLKESDLIPLPELKLEIEKWKQEQTILLKTKTAEMFKQKALKNRESAMQEEIQDSSLSQSLLFQGRHQQFDQE